MASPGAIKAAQAYVELTLRDRLAGGLKGAERRLKRFGSSVRNVGARLVAVSAAMATPLVAGVKVFADFETQMARVATMLDRPEARMDRFRAGVRRMAVEFGESTDALAGGLYDILSASVAPARALEVLGVAVKAAKAGMTDTATAADAITTVLNSYGLAASEAGRVSDLLFSVVKRGKTTFADLAPSIGMVASTAAAGGVSLEELGASLATMTRNGVRTERAVTALNAIVTSFLKPTAEAADYARRLGFEMSGATLRSEGLASVFERIAGLPADAVAKLFPNVRALRGVLPALKNMEGFGRDLAGLAEGAGATEEAYGKMADTLSHVFGRIKQAAVVALGTIGEALAGPVADWGRKILGVTQRVSAWIAANRDLVRTVAKVVVVVGAAGAALVVAGTAMTALGMAFGGLASLASLAAGALSAALGVVGAILSPVGLAVAAVAALGAVILHVTGAGGKALAWLKEKFGALADFAGKTFEGIKDALAAGDVRLAARVLWASLKVAWAKGVGALTTIWAEFKAWILRTWAGAWAGVLSVAETVWHALKVAWIETARFMTKVGVYGVHAIMTAWAWLDGRLRQTWVTLRAYWQETTDYLATQARRAWTRIEADGKRLSAVLETGWEQLKTVWRTVWESAPVQAAADAVTAIWDFVVDRVRDAWHTTAEIGRRVFEHLYRLVAGAWGRLLDIIGFASDRAKQAAGEARLAAEGGIRMTAPGAAGAWDEGQAALDAAQKRAEAERERLQQQLDARLAAIDAWKEAELGGEGQKGRIDAEADDRREAERERHEVRLANIEAELQAELQAIKKGRKASIDAAEDELDAALKAWDEARQRAGLGAVKARMTDALGEALEGWLPAGGGEAGDGGRLAGLEAELDGLSAGVERAAAAADTSGTFSHALASIFGGRGSAQERAARAAEETAEHTAAMDRRLQGGIRVDLQYGG